MRDTFPTLNDPWDARRIPLDGFLERSRFPPLMMAFLAPLGTFILFQFVIFPLTLIPMLASQGASLAEIGDLMTSLLNERIDLLLIGNSVGQVFGLALPAFVLAWLHTSRPGGMLRLRMGRVRLVLGALVGWGVLYPFVTWLGSLNEKLPLPDVLDQFEQQQLELIQQVLMSDMSLAFNLLMLAIIPALCEELLFRGYVQRQAERGLGALGGILFAGIAFGLFHLRLTQVLPLVVLGLYLAYLTWRTGSLWPAILVHFANNAFAVLVGAYVQARPEADVPDVEQMTVPWYVALPALVLFLGLMSVFHREAARLKGGDHTVQ